jgi:hypothetical protein
MPVSIGEGDLARRLADAGEDDPFGRAAGGERPAEFALRHHVEPGALLQKVRITDWLEFAFMA